MRFRRELEKIIDMHKFEPVDELTIKHINEHAQMVIPGPYKLYYSNGGGTIDVVFYWDSDKQRTWWTLKWT